jgi:hypothetical protein
MRWVLFVVAAVELWGQAVSVPASSAKRGESGSFVIRLDSPSGKSPVALQWEVYLPMGVVVAVADIMPGSAAESVEKPITCSPAKNRDEKDKGSTYACILAGGQKPIPNGSIAVIRYRIPQDVQQISGPVRVDHVLGVSVDLKKIDLAKAQGAISLQ